MLRLLKTEQYKNTFMAIAHSRCSSTFLLHETNAKEFFNWRKATEFHRMCKCSLNAILGSFSHVSRLTESKICYCIVVCCSVLPVRSTYVYALIFFQGCVLYPTSFPGSSLYFEKGPWLRLVTCLCMPTEAAQWVGSQLNFVNIL